jgi:hypothetical protein
VMKTNYQWIAKRLPLISFPLLWIHPFLNSTFQETTSSPSHLLCTFIENFSSSISQRIPWLHSSQETLFPKRLSRYSFSTTTEYLPWIQDVSRDWKTWEC